jgi:hypothetical protein
MEKRLVICCGMPRSGSTLQYQIVVEIVKRVSLGNGMGWIRTCSSQDLLSKIEESDTWLIIKIHDYRQITDIKSLICDKRVLLLYSYRDLRDVAVSIAHKDNTKVISLILSDFFDKVLENYYFWTGFPKTFISQYETMTEDLSGEIQRIADYLQIDLDQSTVSQIGQKLSLDNQRKRIANFDFNNKGKRSGASVFDPDTLLHGNHIFSGLSQQWKKELISLEVALIEASSEKWLSETGYGVSQPKIIVRLLHFIFLKEWKIKCLAEIFKHMGNIFIKLQYSSFLDKLYGKLVKHG